MTYYGAALSSIYLTIKIEPTPKRAIHTLKRINVSKVVNDIIQTSRHT